MDIEKMISKEEIEERIINLSYELNEYYKNEEVVIICILKGALIFTADLVRHLKMPLSIEFLKASSYRDKTYSDGIVEVKSDIKQSLNGKNILVIDDIIDTGYTLEKVINILKQDNPKSIKLCTLFNKQERREVSISADFYGFDIPNEFIIGYGLDYDEKYRNLPYIGKVKQIKK